MRKKMSRVDKNERLQLVGESNEKGILMRFSFGDARRTEKGFMQSSFEFPAAYACITDDGSIQVDPDCAQEVWNNIQKKEKEQLGTINKFSKALAISGFIGVIAMFPLLFVNNYLGCLAWAIGLICLGSSIIAQLIIGFGKRLKGDKTFRQTCRFHAAEHAAINAYNDLKRAPTLEEVKNYSMFAYNCSIAAAVGKSWTYIGLGICRLLPGLWMFIPLTIFLFVSIWASKNNYYFTEIGYLETPTDYEYNAAIEVMKKAIQNKEESEGELKEMMNMAECINVVMEVIEDENGNKSPVISINIGGPEDAQEE